MADTPQPVLTFPGGCPDCGRRETQLPTALPALGDDFDWLVRDYDGLRLFMLEQLLARFPERTRWTPADMEVVLVEGLAVLLDQLSDMLDRIAAEAFLETARRPESVRRLLKSIGYDALGLAQGSGSPPFDQAPATGDTRTDAERFDDYWLDHPTLMDQARQEGPRQIHTQKRMVTAADHAERLEDHPLVLRANAYGQWEGSWTTLFAATINIDNRLLDESLPPPILGDALQELRDAVDAFHGRLGLRKPYWILGPTLRSILNIYVEAFRMAGQEVLLIDAEPVGIDIALSLRIAGDYYQSEVQRAVLAALGTGVGGFFEPGRLKFGEDLYAGDIFQTVLALAGIEAACLNRFKRVGKRYPDQSDAGRIELKGLELAVCDKDPAKPERGTLRIRVHGGRLGSITPA